MTVRQAFRHDVGNMDKRMPGKEKRQSQVDRTRPIEMKRRPSEGQTDNQEDDTQVTNKVRIEWAGMGNVCWKIRVPGEREEKHPGTINKAEDAGDYIEEL